MSKLDKDTVIAKFTAAYEAANKKAPAIEAKGGWYSVDGGKNMRLADLNALADSLASNDEPKAAKPKKAAAKPKAKKAAAKTSSFSVKDFYTQQIKEANPGAKAPR